MIGETLTNQAILKRLGWRVELQDTGKFSLIQPGGSTVYGFESEEEAWSKSHHFAPDYVNDLNAASDLTVPGKFLTLEGSKDDNGEWMACYTESGDVVELFYAEIASQAICLAWLAEMDAVHEN